MAESAALLADEVFPDQPVRQWVLSVPYPLRFLLARRPEVMGRVLGVKGVASRGSVSIDPAGLER